jgi:tryptophan synthase alpha subunit
MTASVAAAFLPRAAARNCAANAAEAFAASLSFIPRSHTSDFALLFPTSDPAGDNPGIWSAKSARLSAFTATPSTLPTLKYAGASAQLAPIALLRRRRASTAAGPGSVTDCETGA